jgi:predicted O-linked N-acetylglucosamine transferase (SPINDLY family)
LPVSHCAIPLLVASSNLDEACTEAMKHHIKGRPDLAESLYREILRVDPGHATANHCIGMVHVQQQRASDGIPHLVAALEANPQSRDYWLGYMEALLMSGRTDEAKSTLALGRQHGLDGRAVEDFAQRLDAHLRAALHMESAMLALLEMGKLSEARESAREMTERFPERGLGWKTWGALLGAAGQTDDALVAMRVSARLMPRDAETHTNLAATLMKLERLDEAEACLKTALEIDPDCAVAYAHLGTVYQLQHRYPEAEASLRRSILLSPNDIEFNEIQRRTSLLFVLSHNPAVSAEDLFDEHCRVGAHWEDGLVSPRPRHSNIPDPERRLHIGMVSGDFCDHSVAGFIEPVLALLRNYESIELHGYYNKDSEDHVTRRLRGHFDHWRPVLSLSNEQLADQIKDDGIDVLFDLSGHTFRNRLAAFALKPAPIQVSWLGYPGTSGLSAMDYYLADRHWLPPGEFDGQFTEKLAYLPDRWVFQHHANAPAVNDLPALVAGSMTFGSFSRMSKLTPSTLRLWAPLLRALPNAQMLLGDAPAEDDERRLIDEFAAQGITRDRLIFHGRSTMNSYLALHHRVDLCLDTVPYAGGTTTMHALSMGVPTLTLAGSTPFGRAGAGILAQLGLEAFTATDAADFIAKGEYWATHLGALAEVRRGLRARLQKSPERQPGFFVAQFERALRHMWRRWCARLPAESFHSSDLS